MNTVIDSSKWTGLVEIEIDPYAILLPDERTGELRFDGSAGFVFTVAAGALVLVGLGIVLIVRELYGYVETGRGALFNVPYLRTLLGTAFIGVCIWGIPRAIDRYNDRHKFYPLLINDHELCLGTPAQRIKLDSIENLSAKGQNQSLAELALTLNGIEERGRARDRVAIILDMKVRGSPEPLTLYPSMLNGSPSRIGLIICDRIQKQRARAGVNNV